ncbi:capsular biosynthesis protein [Bombella intestini]|uniref:Capsular biosynthesis protein n=1 Tax=Bombella intestini TaxID=1539051 RepID=A0A1S8GRJ6_9PROT|nr:glycosyltransferase family 2 protein [Bombella intestini]OOL19664.1 capsular biosynthesis protein [Bombella intestini]
MIVIPMAGLSSRFTKAGYAKPKYMLPLAGKTVFWHSLMSFVRYFESERFLFIARDVQDTARFLANEIKELGIKNYEIVLLDQATSGQAETVELGLERAEVPMAESLTIFNIDSFRKNFSYPNTEWFLKCSGYLEVFKGEGNNWSYVEPMPDANGPFVKRTTEKDPISDLCSNGLYYFAQTKYFLEALALERENFSSNELYIAPLYNHLLEKKMLVNYHLIEDSETIFCGVPSEYEFLLSEGL